MTLREAAQQALGKLNEIALATSISVDREIDLLEAALAAEEDESWIDDAIDDATDSNEPLDEIIRKHFRKRGKA